MLEESHHIRSSFKKTLNDIHILPNSSNHDDQQQRRRRKITFESVHIDESTLKDFPESSRIMKYLFPFHLIFIWLLPFLFKSFFKVIKMNDLPKLDKKYKCEYYEKKFSEKWEKFNYKNENENEKKRKNQLFLTLYSVFGWEFLYSAMYKLISCILSAIFPMFITFLLDGLKPSLSDVDKGKINSYRDILPNELKPPNDIDFYLFGYRKNNSSIWIWLFLTLIFQMATVIVSQYSFYIAIKVGTKMRLVLTRKIYEKVFLVESTKIKNGEILNYLANDCYNIDTSHIMVLDVVFAFVFILFSSVFLFYLMGWTALLSLLYCFFCISSILGINTIIYNIRFKYFDIIDERINKMKESFSNMLDLKFFVLENKFLNKIINIRDKELSVLGIMLGLQTFNNALAYTCPPIMVLIGFVAYYYYHGHIDVASLFGALTYFTMFRNSISAMSYQAVLYFNALSSMKRVQSFLQEDDKSSKWRNSQKLNHPLAIRIENGNFSWGEKEGEVKTGGAFKPQFSLNNMNVIVERGKLMMVVGKTRSGKSTFLKSLLNETNASKETKVEINGDICYVSQSPWIENNTILENIILGAETDAEKLKCILNVCGLNRDLDDFEGGVHLEIGENGSTISGGQKSRISLARACYFDKEIFILDNILSSLDSYVANHVMQYCILRYLGGKTRIMVTNKSEFYPYADEILFFENGMIAERGTYDDLVAMKGKFFEILNNKTYKKEEEDTNKFGLEELYKSNIISIAIDCEKRKVFQREERNTGCISWDTIRSFCGNLGQNFSVKKSACCGVIIVFLLFCLYMIGMSSYFASEFHIANLATLDIYHHKYSNEFNTTYYHFNGSRIYYNDTCPGVEFNCTSEIINIIWNNDYKGKEIKGISGGLSLLIYFFNLIFIFVFCLIQTGVFLFCCVYTSRRMFRKAITRLFSAPMNWFYTNPIGRMISRLSYDIVRFDYDLIVKLENNVSMLYVVGGIGGLVIGMSEGLFTPIVIICVIIILCVFFFFRKTAMELKRLEAVSRSQVFHHFNQTLNGLVTIKAYDLEERFKGETKYWIDFHNRSYFLGLTVQRMLEQYLSITSALLVALTVGICVIISYSPNFGNDYYGLINVGIANLYTVVEIFCYLMTQFVDIEVQANAIERLDYYANYLDEEQNEKDVKKPINIKNGRIRFDRFWMKYQKDFPMVLKNLSFDIPPNEKMCIIGRTGSGKSSIMNSIMRIVEREKGGLEIDHQDIEMVNIKHLREQISIIPQNPILFVGSIRSNLDPFDQYTDEDIWEVIEKCHLTSIVTRENGLTGLVLENAENFSVGEKRLLCLCRALLKRNKIILMDECCSISYHLDDVMQKVVTSLQGVTVLGITHRIDNIVYYDRIMLMDGGSIVVCGTIDQVVKNKDFLTFMSLLPNRNELMKVFMSVRK